MSFKHKLRTELVKTNRSLVLGIVVILILACSNDSPMQPEPRPEGWIFMNLADKEIHRVRLFGDYLYACANRDGLFRINVKEDSAEWQYLGLADSALPRGIDGVKDVAVLDNMILVAYSTPNPDDTGIFRAKVEEFDWQPSDSGMDFGGIRILSQFPTNRQIVFAGDAGGTVYRSNDFGLTWENALAIITTGPVISVIGFHPIHENEIWVGGEWFDGSELWQSTDFGESWQDREEILKNMNFQLTGDSLHTDRTLLDIAFDPVDEDIFYIASSRLWKTQDNGQTWTAVFDTTGAYWTVVINPLNSNEILLSTGNNVSMSEDGGKIWRRISLPEPESVVSFLEVNWQAHVLYTHMFSRDISSKVLGVYKLYF